MSDELDLQFAHIGLHVGDTKAAAEFFVDRLQLDLLEENADEGDTFLRVATGSRGALSRTRLRFPETRSEVRLIGNPGAPLADGNHANRGTCHVCFYTDDLRSTWGNLEKAGTRLCSTDIIKIRGGVFDGGSCIYCVGPDGFRIEFLEGPAYLDGTLRDPAKVLQVRRANEASHIGLHVRDRDLSLAFYRDLLGIREVAGWLEKTESTRAVIGYPTAELWMSILRLPGTQSFFEIIEYRGVDGVEIDNSLRSNGACHLSFRVSDMSAMLSKLESFGSAILHREDRSVWCEDPDGYRVQFTSE